MLLPSPCWFFFLLLTCQLAKTNIEGTTTVPTNVMSIVACTTDETVKPLVKSVCDTVSENLVLGSHQDLGMHHNCSVKKATTYYWIAVERKFEAHFIESVYRGTELRPWHCLTDVTSQGWITYAKQACLRLIASWFHAFFSKTSTPSSVQPNVLQIILKGKGALFFSFWDRLKLGFL